MEDNKEEKKEETSKKEEVKTTATQKEVSKKEEPKKETSKKEETKTNTAQKKAEVKEEKKFEPVKTMETKKTVTTNTTSKPKAEKGKKKNIALRIIAVIIALVVVVALIYIALPSPARALQQMLTNLKAGNYEKINEYVEYDDLMNMPVMSSENEEQNKLFFQNLEFSVKNVKVEGNKATIELETTNKDFKAIMQKCITKLIQKYLSDKNTEEIENILLEELQNDNSAMTTTTQNITVQKQDGKWKVVVDENLQNAIFPGLLDALKTLTDGNIF